MKEVLKKYAKRYFIDAMGAMALGLFASLLIGTIFETIGKFTGIDFLYTVASYAKSATGMAIGVAMALKLNAHPLVIFSCASVGAMANAMGAIIEGNQILTWAATAKGNTGIFYSAGPAGAFFAVIVACEIGMLVSKKTKIDILVTPIVTILAGFAASWVFCPGISYLMYYLGVFISTATTFQPFLMGVAVSVVVGIVLTLPISSAAICAMIFSESALAVAVLNGTSEGFLLAGGAAVAGCCAQMVGFAVLSFRENRWGGLVSQGLGTSMLQMGNIVKNPRVWIAPTLASAVTGPVATCLFRLRMDGPPVSSGMGTCGLVGQIGVYTGWVADIAAGAKAAITAMDWIGLVLVCFVLPAILSWVFCQILRRIGWIKDGDLKLNL